MAIHTGKRSKYLTLPSAFYERAERTGAESAQVRISPLASLHKQREDKTGCSFCFFGDSLWAPSHGDSNSLRPRVIGEIARDRDVPAPPLKNLFCLIVL